MRKLLSISSFLMLGLTGMAADEVDFNKDVKPILSNTCFHCHGNDAHDIKGNLQMHTFEHATSERKKVRKSGKVKILPPAIVPGKPEESLAWELINGDEDDIMPPKKSHKVLSKKDKEILYKWIKSGAKYDKHWAFEPVKNTPVPETKAKWAKNSIDQFIAKKQEKLGISVMPEAKKETLIRRLSLDLRGVVPSKKEVTDFVADKSANAYDTLVNKFLADSAFGEHMASYWLDSVRYADTHGMHFDNMREIWPYRDWVVNSLNSNMSYDKFLTDQVAGDLLPEPTKQQLVATGFNRAHITSNEGGSIQEELRVQYTVDRAGTFGSVFMGLTVGCAQCHDHKFDPVSRKEFYQLTAFFSNGTDATMDKNRAYTDPYVHLYNKQEQGWMDDFQKKLSDTEARLKKIMNEKELSQWVDSRTDADKKSPKGALYSLDFEKEEDWLGKDGKSSTKGLRGKAFHRKKASKLPLKKAKFSLDKPFTIAMWLRDMRNQDGTVLLSNVIDDKGLELTYNKDHELILKFHNGNAASFLGVESKFYDLSSKRKDWHHVVVTYDGKDPRKGVKFYFDGQKMASNLDDHAFSGDIKQDKVPELAVNRVNEMDEFRFYERALSESEIVEKLYSAKFFKFFDKPYAKFKNKAQRGQSAPVQKGT